MKNGKNNVINILEDGRSSSALDLISDTPFRCVEVGGRRETALLQGVGFCGYSARRSVVSVCVFLQSLNI